ncbi:decaprenyl-phosphate phosphoribosyltransferase [uncultured Cellulomonas sp.]|uniref:decaprenyl-phosphate phosphoribosyltransferase n=1 Tax=uncultured Cellulomonas sp. TaxID=189682 RepID=UPI0026225D8E|nr:decaprenyl-phosphate phosphoribosyltransferase [uncultured Cellulomonas sp.]
MTTLALGATGSMLAALRVRQWIKNLLVVAPLLPAAELVGPDALAGAGVAFAMFCLLSSGIYLLNDVLDVEADRAHPVKRHRPVAAGTVTAGSALVLAGALLLGGLGLATVRGTDLVVVAVAYLAIQVAYCLGVKRVPVLELGAVASGFLLRALAGGVGAGIPLSPWFLLTAGFGSLFVAAGKRYGEARRGEADGTYVRDVVRAYSPSYLRFVWTTAAAIVVGTYSLWAFQVDSESHSTWTMLSTVPFVLALLRYAMNVDAGRAEEPEEIVLHDRMLLTLGLIWAASLVVAELL